VSVVEDSVESVKGCGDKLTANAGAALTVKPAVATPLAVVTDTVRRPVAAPLVITNVADCDVDDPPPAALAVTPAPLTLIAVIFKRFVPVIVTGTVWPCSPDAGVKPVMVGAGAVTVNATDTFCEPTVKPKVVPPVAAPAVIVMDALTLVLDGAPLIVPLIPALPEMTAVAADRFVPVKVTLKVLPPAPLAGETEVSVGVPDTTVKAIGTDWPPTVRLRVVAPSVALALMVTVAATVVLVTVPSVAVTPVFGDVTAVVPVRLVPVKVTGNVVPVAPDAGLTDVSVTAGLTVKPTKLFVPPTVRPMVVPPVAAAPVIVIDAVTEVAEVDVIVPLTPLLPDTTAVALDRPVPVKVTGKVVPTVPDAGLTDVSVTAGLTVKFSG